MKRILTFILLLIITLSSFLISLPLSGCGSKDPVQLDVYIWEGYLPEKAAGLFEQEYGIQLNINFISDYNQAFTLLRGGGKADVVMPTHSQAIMYYEYNLVQPLDLKIIKNYENISPILRNQQWTKWDGTKMGAGDFYSAPYVFGSSGIAINTSKYTKNIDNMGWEVFFDTSLAKRVSAKGGIASIWMIIDVLNLDRENLINDTENTLESIREKAIELNRNVLKFYNTNTEIIDIMKNEEVWVAHIEDANGRKLAQFNSKFKYILPKTGGLGWIDTFMIPKTTANTFEANQFIDFMLRPEIAAMLTEESGYKTLIDGALDKTEGIDKNNYSFTEKQLEELLWTPNLSEDVRSAVSEFWEEISVEQ